MRSRGFLWIFYLFGAIAIHAESFRVALKNAEELGWVGSTDCYYYIETRPSLTESNWDIASIISGYSGFKYVDISSIAEGLDRTFLRVLSIPVTNITRDADGDGMPDCWELSNGLAPLISDSSQDGDMDGLSNYQEFRNGTSPQSRDSNTNFVPDGWDLYAAPLIKGDLNGDGLLSADDLTALDAMLTLSTNNVTPVTFAQADLNSDGVLDEIDRQGLQDLLEGRPLFFMLNSETT